MLMMLLRGNTAKGRWWWWDAVGWRRNGVVPGNG
jgi:hypothetical protein